MKRFVTYLYTYKNGQKIKNTGHIRVDVKGPILEMQVSIKDAELDYAKGTFYVVIKTDKIFTIALVEIQMQNGEYRGRFVYDCKEQKERTVQFKDIIGVCINYENNCYMASCWRDGEEERMAIGSFLKADLLQEQVENQVEIVGERKAEDISRDIIKGAAEVVIEELVKNPTKNSREEIKEETATDMTKVAIKDVVEDILESKTFAEEADSVSGTSMKAAAILEPEIKCDPEFRTAPCYRKINLSEIYTLPSSYWHFSNNSFLLHGFWNYGYLVVKEDVAQNEKKMLLGVPGIFEQPEMVMASYFGFPKFEALPSEMEAMEIGETYSCEKKNQQPQTGIFGCWFTNL